ncbi:FKBP-type peptidyl-prolyl cis-trans isomerase [Pedobacter sp.]|nr:FKBP-type peptidyl-prolyl cis-trans isomerase [Candidatus Saccharibacteria bacterium]
MATPKHQRVFIWIIAIVMAIGSLGAYFVTILANDNGEVAQSDSSQQAQIDAYVKQQEEAARANAALASPLEGYSAATFDAASVTSLQKEDLVVGTGDVVAEGATVTVSYFGWTPDGKIFDSTTKSGTNTPAADFPLEVGKLIDGWVSGLPGMKVGGVRKLVIPAAQAYKEAGSPPLIAANTPLTFILRVESIKQ